MEGTFCTSVHSVLGDILLWMDYVSMGEIICTTYIYVSICEYAQVIFFLAGVQSLKLVVSVREWVKLPVIYYPCLHFQS